MGNKNHLKNINDQNFTHFMRGYDKGFYGIIIISLKWNQFTILIYSWIVTNSINILNLRYIYFNSNYVLYSISKSLNIKFFISIFAFHHFEWLF